MCVVKSLSYDCGHLRVGVIKVRCPDNTDKFLGFPRPTSSCPKLTSFEESIEGEDCPTCEARYELEHQQLELRRRQLDRLSRQNEMNRAELARKWQLFTETDSTDTESDKSHTATFPTMDPSPLHPVHARGEYIEGGASTSIADFQKATSTSQTQARHNLAEGRTRATRHSNPERRRQPTEPLNEAKDFPELTEEQPTSSGKCVSAPESADWRAVYQHRENQLKSKTGSLRVNLGIGSKREEPLEAAPTQTNRTHKPLKADFKAFDPTSRGFLENDTGVGTQDQVTTSALDHREEDEIFVSEKNARNDFFVDWTSLQPRPSVVANAAQKSVSRRVSRIKSRLSSRNWGSVAEQPRLRCLTQHISTDGPSTKISRNDSLFLPQTTNSNRPTDTFLQAWTDVIPSDGSHNMDTIREEPSMAENRDPASAKSDHGKADLETRTPDYFAPYRKSRASQAIDDREYLPSRRRSDRGTRGHKRLTQAAPSVPSDVSLELANAMVEFSAKATASSTTQQGPIHRKPVAVSSRTSSWARGDDSTDLPQRTARLETFTPVERSQVSMVSIMPRPPPKAVLPPRPKPEEAPCVSLRKPLDREVPQPRKTVRSLDQLFRSDSIVGERQAILRRSN